ncbi:L-serine ammonia-lyase [Streptomonospora nanhaiensis]|uniref:L-serine dehydratase n=1 Tax=Streptomonospora nanhaiensis TaxID=1323731 RepID=A0A853BS80_9ACTN|nr:L-serine ammonia-lyase [Streptomonospora nanhaiensis]MBX9387283.1 L-serine ammonia-lyase [Streptomonospora nanhaiensis]NYI98003.1 L-serine dehydratase [Streptomonospora nanhaiensis]
MAISAFDLFTIGIGPSSSHTVGPMRAARTFVTGLADSGLLERTASVRAELYGSLALTGKGHGSDRAVLLGLMGETPEDVDVDAVPALVESVAERGRLALGGVREIPFDPAAGIDFRRRESLPGHPNGMRFLALDADGAELRSRTYFSVGGGFVVDEAAVGADRITPDDTRLPYPFASAAELLERCRETGLSISAIMLANEQAFGRSAAEVRAGLLEIWRAMRECVRRGVTTEGTLPGGLKVPRRAPRLYRQLGGSCDDAGLARPTHSDPADPMRGTDWISLYALAVNEENAAGGRVVTAPTNGAAGIVPAVLHYYSHFTQGASDDGAVRFLLTAAAIGILYKQNASISGAEVGCQGEVGSASSMAAAGLAEAWGATPAQVENAAEIAMEHNLGLTCDPIGGLVQVPCIERNALAAVKAVSATRMALRGDGSHFVSLDKVIKTMRDTGRDMMDKYKETSRGGLAVNVIEC